METEENIDLNEEDQVMFRKIYIQLICITKTRNGKLIALG
jgi:hypothetical protein